MVRRTENLFVKVRFPKKVTATEVVFEILVVFFCISLGIAFMAIL